jgi:hypothetical protein
MDELSGIDGTIVLLQTASELSGVVISGIRDSLMVED